MTPKGQASRRGARVPRLLVVLAVGTTAAIAWFTLTAFGLTPTRYAEPGAAVAAGFFAAVNLALLVAAISRIRAARFAGERRASVRFSVRLAAHLSGRRATALDVSLTGAQLIASTRPKLGAPIRLALNVDGTRLGLRGIVRRSEPQPDGRTMVGLEFADGQMATVVAWPWRSSARKMLPGAGLPSRRPCRRPGERSRRVQLPAHEPGWFEARQRTVDGGAERIASNPVRTPCISTHVKPA